MHKTKKLQNTDSNPAGSINQSRRKALKKIAVGGACAGAIAMSGKWSKPVVNSIILPAHAQATNAAGPIGTTTPAPTTTAGSCTIKLENSNLFSHRDANGYYDQPITISGTVVNMAKVANASKTGKAFIPEANQPISIVFEIYRDGATQWETHNLSATTDNGGAWSVTYTDYAGGLSSKATITGPCGDTAVVDDQNLGA